MSFHEKETEEKLSWWSDLGDEQDCLGGVAPPALLRLFRVAANLFVFLVELQVEAHVDLRGVVGLRLFGTLGYED